MRNALRACKNFTKGYSDIQIRLRDATSIVDHGPTMGQLEDIASATFHPTMFADIVYVLDKRLNDHGKYWKHVYKTLVVMEYCIVCGSEALVSYAKESIYTIRTLKEFQYIDDRGRDQGIQVRQKSIEIVALLSDEARLAEARRTKTLPHNLRPASTEPVIYHDKSNGRKLLTDGKADKAKRANSDGTLNQRGASALPADYDEDAALQRAIEESRRTAASSASLGSKTARPQAKAAAESVDLLSLDDSAFEKTIQGLPSTSRQSHRPARQSETHVGQARGDPFGGGESYTGISPFGEDDDRRGRKPLSASQPIVMPASLSPNARDPFADVTETFKSRNPRSPSIQAAVPPKPSSATNSGYVPMPLAPGQAPPSVDLQVGAKPVQPFTSAPQFSGSNAHGAAAQKYPEDPFGDFGK